MIIARQIFNVNRFVYGQNTKKLFNKGDFVMIFQDNIMKEYLKNVYFITGTPCGGKTTLSCALAEKYGFELFFL